MVSLRSQKQGGQGVEKAAEKRGQHDIAELVPGLVSQVAGKDFQKFRHGFRNGDQRDSQGVIAQLTGISHEGKVEEDIASG